MNKILDLPLTLYLSRANLYVVWICHQKQPNIGLPWQNSHLYIIIFIPKIKCKLDSGICDNIHGARAGLVRQQSYLTDRQRQLFSSVSLLMGWANNECWCWLLLPLLPQYNAMPWLVSPTRATTKIFCRILGPWRHGGLKKIFSNI